MSILLFLIVTLAQLFIVSSEPLVLIPPTLRTRPLVPVRPRYERWKWLQSMLSMAKLGPASLVLDFVMTNEMMLLALATPLTASSLAPLYVPNPRDAMPPVLGKGIFARQHRQFESPLPVLTTLMRRRVVPPPILPPRYILGMLLTR